MSKTVTETNYNFYIKHGASLLVEEEELQRLKIALRRQTEKQRVWRETQSSTWHGHHICRDFRSECYYLLSFVACLNDLSYEPQE